MVMVINLVASKIAKNIGIISRIAYLLPAYIFKTLYYSMIYPYLSYCNLIWASNYSSRLQRINVLQNRFIRIICRKTKLDTPLNTNCIQILSIKNINALQINLFMFKYSRNQLPICFNNYFTNTCSVNPYKIRTNLNLRPIFCRTRARQFSLKYLGPQTWNFTPLEIRSLASIRGFKKNYIDYLLGSKSIMQTNY